MRDSTVTCSHRLLCELRQTSFPTWFDHLEESVSCKEIFHFKKFCLLVKTPAGDAKETIDNCY